VVHGGRKTFSRTKKGVDAKEDAAEHGGRGIIELHVPFWQDRIFLGSLEGFFQKWRARLRSPLPSGLGKGECREQERGVRGGGGGGAGGGDGGSCVWGGVVLLGVRGGWVWCGCNGRAWRGGGE